MANLILPRRFTQQPQYPVELDRSNPFGSAVVHGMNTAVPYFDIYSWRQEYTAVGTQNYLASQKGSAFTGTGSSCLTSDVAPRIDPYNCSFSAWVIPAATTTAGIASSGNTSNGHRFQIDLDGGSFRAIAVGSNVAAASTAATANVPVFLSCVFSGTSSRKIYLDGVLKNTNTTAVSFTGSFNRSNFGAILVSGVPYQTYLTNGSKLIDPVWLNRALSDAEVVELYKNHWQIFRRSPQVLYFDVGGGGSPYTLTAASGTFALTGNATALKAARKLTATAQSYTVTGNATALKAARKLTAATGSFTYTGNGATLKSARNLVAATGAFTLTGIDVGLTYTPVGGSPYTLTAATGSFALTGNAAALKAARKIVAAATSFTLTGNAAGLVAGRKLTAASGTFTLTGNAATLTADIALVLTAGTGVFALTGGDVTFLYTQVSAWTVVGGASGSWSDAAGSSDTWTDQTAASGTWNTI